MGRIPKSEMTSQKTWTVVKFEEKGLTLVEAIPTTWIDGDVCFWPPYITATPAIMTHEVPNPKTWKLCKFTSFKKSTFNDYEVARKKANLALTTSDLESDPEPTKRKKRRIIESDESDTEEFKTKLPAPPTYSVQNRRSKKRLDNEQNVLLNGVAEEESGQASCVQDPNSSLSNDADNTLENTLVNVSHHLQQDSRASSTCSTPIARPMSRESFNITVPATPINQSMTTSMCNCTIIHEQQDLYMKQIIRKQNVLQALMSQLIDDVGNLSRHRQKDVDENPTTSIFGCFNFPLTDNEQLDKFEEYLKQENNFQLAVNEISKIGGQTTYDFARRCLSRLMTDRLAKEYSWQGAKKKKVFGSLKMADLIIQSALRNSTTSAASIKEIELAVKQWLRRAKERDEKKKKNPTN